MQCGRPGDQVVTAGMLSPMRDKNEGIHRGGEVKTPPPCDHVLPRRSLRVNLSLRVELESKMDYFKKYK